jgi:hypothetical protein
MRKFASVLTTLLIFFSVTGALAQSTAPVTVTGLGMHYGGKVIYRYQIRNSSPSPVTRVLIGHHISPNDGKAELYVPPDSTEDSLLIPASVAARPYGWGVLIRYAEESNYFWLEWAEAAYFKKLWPGAATITENPLTLPGKALPSGAMWDDFSVTLPEVDEGYVTGHASVVYGEKSINVPIQKGDALPPAVTLSVERVNQNEGKGHWAIFDVRASASDNYDPTPTLTFSPVTANQVIRAGDVSIDAKSGRWKVKLRNAPGRIYRLQVTSSDASGNKATKVFDYAVSDGGRK